MEAQSQVPILHVAISDVVPPIEREFTSPFRIGRADQCDISIKHEYVSRQHVEVSYQDGRWWVEDLHSNNGIFLNGKKVMRIPVGESAQVRLGIAGPILALKVMHPPAPKAAGDDTMVERYIQRYFAGKSDEAAGEHTVFVRRAAAKVHARERRNYQWLVAALVIVLVVAGVYAWRVQRQLNEQKSSAQALFYAMKSLDLDMGNLQTIVQNSSQKDAGLAEIQKYRARRVDLERNYDRFLATLKVYDPKLTPRQKLILRVARIFGECELDMPKNFEAEIDRYIQRWRQTDRLRTGIERAKNNGVRQP